MSVFIKFSGIPRLIWSGGYNINNEDANKMIETIHSTCSYWWILPESTYYLANYRYSIRINNNSANTKSLKSILLELKNVLVICKSFGFDVDCKITYWANYQGCSDNGVIEIDTRKSTIKYKGQLGIENVITF